MKEHPILFSAPMVRAILEGRKTQTRRVVKPQPPASNEHWEVNVCPDCVQFLVTTDTDPDYENPIHQSTVRNPYGQPGDRLWVRENFSIGEDLGEGWESWMSQGDRFSLFGDGYSDYKVPEDYILPRNAKETHYNQGEPEHWRQFGPIPSIFMPRWASRILLEVVSVRVERLNNINESDCIAEGTPGGHGSIPGYNYSATPLEHYCHLWESINGAGSWTSNPWVWVIEFKRVQP